MQIHQFNSANRIAETRQYAYQLAALGYYPIATDSNGKPCFSNPFAMQANQSESNRIDRNFDHEFFGLAIKTGAHHVNLEVIQIQAPDGSKMRSKFMKGLKSMYPQIWDKLVIGTNKHDVVDIYYQTNFSHKPQCFAMNFPVTISPSGSGFYDDYISIQTKSDFGYVVSYPTPGYHFTKGEIQTIVLLSDSERKSLIMFAKSFSHNYPFINKLQDTFIRFAKWLYSLTKPQRGLTSVTSGATYGADAQAQPVDTQNAK